MFNKALIIGILLFGATFSVSANEAVTGLLAIGATASAKNVQKWEYKCLYTNRDDYSYRSKPVESFERELNELGSEGWEMQGYAMNDGANARYLCFKRKKS